MEAEHSRKLAVLPLPTLSLDTIPLKLPLRRSFRVRHYLQYFCCFPLPSYPKRTLPDLVVRR